MQPKSQVHWNFPIHTKAKHQETQPAHLNNYFSKERQAGKSRRQNSKDLLPKSPPTPDLQSLKLDRMKRQQENIERNHNRQKSPITLLQKSVGENNDFEEDNTPTNYVCTSHPNKKAKYFLASDINVRLCTTCAVNYAKVEPVLDEDKYHKLKGIDEFRSMIKMVKGFLQERQEDIGRQSRTQDIHYESAIRTVDQEFQAIILLIQQKHNQLVDSLTSKYRQSSQNLKSQRILVATINTALQKYLFDVDRNYDQIINYLSVGQFDDIMSQYQRKMAAYVAQVDKKFEALPDVNHLKSEASDISARVKRLTLQGNGRYSIIKAATFERKENNNFLNILKGKGLERYEKPK